MTNKQMILPFVAKSYPSHSVFDVLIIIRLLTECAQSKKGGRMELETSCFQ